MFRTKKVFGKLYDRNSISRKLFAHLTHTHSQEVRKPEGSDGSLSRFDILRPTVARVEVGSVLIHWSRVCRVCLCNHIYIISIENISETLLEDN